MLLIAQSIMRMLLFIEVICDSLVAFFDHRGVVQGRTLLRRPFGGSLGLDLIGCLIRDWRECLAIRSCCRLGKETCESMVVYVAVSLIWLLCVTLLLACRDGLVLVSPSADELLFVSHGLVLQLMLDGL